MMYGSLEVFAKQALKTYFSGGKAKCDSTLPWIGWGEDFYMGKCMLMIGVQPFDDFGMLSDGVCTGVYCGNNAAAAFHPFKTSASWMACFKQAIGQR